MIGDIIDLGLHRVLTKLQIDSYPYGQDNQKSNIGLIRYCFDESSVVKQFRFFYKLFQITDPFEPEEKRRYAIVANSIDMIQNQYRFSEMSMLRNEDKFYNLPHIEENLKRTLDIYIDGVRVDNDLIQLFISENSNIITVPMKYIKDIGRTDIAINARTYVAEWRTSVSDGSLNQIYLPLKYQKMAHNVYCDGKLVTDYITSVEDGELLLKFVEDYGGKDFWVSIIKDIKIQRQLPQDMKYFKMENIRGVVIPDNMYVYKDGLLETTTIRNPYPNIFELEDKLLDGDKVLQVFYKNKHIQVNWDLIYFYDKLFNLVGQLNSGKAPRYVRENYQLPTVGYKMANYRDNFEPKGIDLFTFQQMLFAQMIRHNPYNYNKYLDMLEIATRPKIIDMSKQDYSSYLYSDNKNQMIDERQWVEFQEDKILISFGNPIKSSFNIWVDGFLTEAYSEFYEDGISYLYFSQETIKPETVIEIDCYKNIPDIIDSVEYLLEEDMSGEHILKLTTLGLTDIKDLKAFVFDSARKCFIETSLVEHDIVNGQLVITHDDSLIGKRIKLVNTWIAFNKSFPNYRIDRTATTLYMSQFNLCKKENEYYSVYVNGRYIDKSEWELEYPTKTNDENMTSIRLFTIGIKDDGVPPVVQYHPFEKHTVIGMERVPDNGIVYLRGLPAAFSFKYFDLYLNGRKLNHTNVSIISDNVILLRNVRSRDFLYIVTRYHMAELPYQQLYLDNSREFIFEREDKEITCLQDLIVLALWYATGNTGVVNEYTQDEIGDIFDCADILDRINEHYKPDDTAWDEDDSEDPYRDYLDSAVLDLWLELYEYMRKMSKNGRPVVDANVSFDNSEFLRRFYPLIRNGRLPIDTNIIGHLMGMPIDANDAYANELTSLTYANLYNTLKEVATSGEQMVNANTIAELIGDLYPIIKNGKIKIGANMSLDSDRMTINANEIFKK